MSTAHLLTGVGQHLGRLLGRPLFPPVNKMTHRCKNITLLQTSFMGGKKGNSEEHQKGNLDAANNLGINIRYHISQLSKNRDVSEETIFRNLSFFQAISFVHVIVMPRSLIFMSTHKATAARCLRYHQATYGQPPSAWPL